MRTKCFFTGIAAFALVFGLMFTGCGDDPSGAPPGGDGGLGLTDNTAEGHDGVARTISGTFYFDYEFAEDPPPKPLEGTLGTIAADGTVTVNLPGTVANSNLFNTGDENLKKGCIKLTTDNGKTLVLKKDTNIVAIMYFSTEVEDMNIVRGWNYYLPSDVATITGTQLAACRWALQP